MKLKLWMNDWLEYYIKPMSSERTYLKYASVTSRHILPTLGEFELNELSPAELQKFTVKLSKDGLSANTVSGIISVLKNALGRAHFLEICEKDFSAKIVYPKAKERPVECLSVKEQQAIERYALNSRRKNLLGIVLCLYTGLRIGELLALTWDNIDFSKHLITVCGSCHDRWINGQYVKVIESTKTSSSNRVIPFPKQLTPCLREMKKVSPVFVVYGKSNYGAQVRSYQRTFTNLQKRLGIPHHNFHALRHTFATRAIECGMDVKSLSEILGHKNPSITLSRYAHSLLEHKTEMMNKVGKIFSNNF